MLILRELGEGRRKLLFCRDQDPATYHDNANGFKRPRGRNGDKRHP
jgi:hypothetical protein